MTLGNVMYELCRYDVLYVPPHNHTDQEEISVPTVATSLTASRNAPVPAGPRFTHPTPLQFVCTRVLIVAPAFLTA